MAAETSGMSAVGRGGVPKKPAHARSVCQVRRPQPGVADDDPVGGTFAGGLPDGDNEVPGLGEEPSGVRAGERA
ncbi:hypothetical protein NXX19_16815 [Bacteroides ovatus]|nr:hypothetical protein [Bacteroides ovatus]